MPSLSERVGVLERRADRSDAVIDILKQDVEAIKRTLARLPSRHEVQCIAAWATATGIAAVMLAIAIVATLH